MRIHTSVNQSHQNDDLRKSYQAELQRKFVDLQFKRSELEKQLKIVNDVLFSLGREMERTLAYEHLYKWRIKSGDAANSHIGFIHRFLKTTPT